LIDDKPLINNKVHSCQPYVKPVRILHPLASDDIDDAIVDTLPAPLPQVIPGEQPLPAGWRRVRFGDVVRNINVTVDPNESGLERYIAGEHMETDDLHIRRWGTIGDGYLGPAFHRKFVAGQILYGSRRTYLRKVAVADFDGVCANTTFVLEPANDELISDLLPLFRGKCR
jgi:hypothetical protein